MFDIINKNVGGCGRMVWAEKYNLPAKLKGHKIVWNANIIVDGKKVWYGDIDLTADAPGLHKAADEIGKALYVLTERAARFDNEENPLVDEAVAIIEPNTTGEIQWLNAGHY
jgi:hypothetical protein